MQMCPNCENYYDESEYPYCPYCCDGAPDDYRDYIEIYFDESGDNEDD